MMPMDQILVFITDIDKHSGNNSFKQTIYVNPMENTFI